MDEKCVTDSAGESREGQGISRRQVLKLGAFSAIGAVGMGLAGCSDNVSVVHPAAVTPKDFEAAADPIPATQISKTLTFDVVVVGAGAAGVPAAMAARELGAKVAVLQKGPTALSQGSIAGGINLQKTNNPAAVASLMQTISNSNDNRSRWSLLMTWANNSGAAVAKVKQWATAGGLAPSPMPVEQVIPTVNGNVYLNLSQFGPKPTYNNGDGVRAVAVTAAKAGVEFQYNTPAVQLVKEGKRVVAVIGKNSDGEYIRYNASKGVILTTGDYQNNVDMVKKYCPDVLNLDKKQVGKTGDGHLMGMWVGAVMEPIGHTKMAHDFDSGPMFYEPFLRVNDNGERFCNEQAPFEYTINRLVDQPHTESTIGWFCQIFGSDYVAQVETWNPAAPGAPSNATSPTKLLNSMPNETVANRTGVYPDLIATYKANSIYDLAAQLKVPAGALQNAVDDYNAICATGIDVAFGKDPKYLKPIDGPTYYGIRKHLRCSAIMSGLVINENAQCLDAAGKVIPGLYAAGNCSGPFYGGADYPILIAGLSISRANTFGYIAGQHAAQS